MKITRLILVLMVFCLLSCEKDDSGPNPFYTNKILKGFTWEVFGKETGLLDDFITCITIDELNNKWIGTYSNGIAKFDGIEWEIFNTSNSGLPNDSIEEITFDSNGILWIGTKRSGVVKFNEDEWIVYKDDDLPGISNLVRSLSVDMDNNKWIAYGHNDEGGLIKFDDTNWTLFTIENSLLPSKIIDQIHIDIDNRIWVGTHSGLVCIQNGKWTVFNKDNTIMPYNWIWDISSDSYGNIWFGSNAILYREYFAGTLLRFDGKYWYENKPSESGKTTNRANSIVTDNWSNIWVATVDLTLEQSFGYQISMFNDLWIGGISVGLIKIEMEFE